MKKILILSLAALALLSACKKDSLTDTTNSFTATIEQSGDKTTLGTPDASGNRSVQWSTNDQIRINGVLYTGTPDNDNATQATFTSESTVTANLNSPYYVAYYPADIYDGTTATLPATQDYDATTNGISNLPMYAAITSGSDNHNLVFKNLCAVLAITVNSDEMSTVTSIEVSSALQMNGSFTVDGSYNIVFTASGEALTDADKKVTLTVGEGYQSITDSRTFYIAVPAQEYSAGLTIKAIGTYNSVNVTKKMKTKTADAVTLERNTIYPITFSRNALPDGVTDYSDCNYIEAIGNQYVKTGITTTTSQTIKFKFTAQGVTATNSNQILIGRNSTDINYFGLTDGTHWSLGSGMHTLTPYTTKLTNAVLEFTSQYLKCYITGDANSPYTYTHSNDPNPSGTEFYIFIAPNHLSEYHAKARLWYCKEYVNGILQGDFIPVKRTSDNKYGLYNLENNTFYGNSGSGSLSGN